MSSAERAAAVNRLIEALPEIGPALHAGQVRNGGIAFVDALCTPESTFATSFVRPADTSS
jgi:hypothetical protein